MRRLAILTAFCLAQPAHTQPAHAQPATPSIVAPRPASGDSSDPCGCGDNARCRLLCGNPGAGGGGGIGSDGGTGGIGTQRVSPDLLKGNRPEMQLQRRN